MFDKRLMAMCPESRKYIAGNIICQWTELLMNAVMIFIISNTVGRLYSNTSATNDLIISIAVLGITLIVRLFLTKKTSEMSYLASKTVKRVMREQIYKCGEARHTAANEGKHSYHRDFAYGTGDLLYGKKGYMDTMHHSRRGVDSTSCVFSFLCKDYQDGRRC